MEIGDPRTFTTCVFHEPRDKMLPHESHPVKEVGISVHGESKNLILSRESHESRDVGSCKCEGQEA